MKIFTTFWFGITCPNTAQQPLYFQTGWCSGAAQLSWTSKVEEIEWFAWNRKWFSNDVTWSYLFCALVGGVTQLFSSKLFGPIDTGVLGFVAPFPAKHAVFSGEQDLRLDFRHDRLRNRSLKRKKSKIVNRRRARQTSRPDNDEPTLISLDFLVSIVSGTAVQPKAHPHYD